MSIAAAIRSAREDLGKKIVWYGGLTVAVIAGFASLPDLNLKLLSAVSPLLLNGLWVSVLLTLLSVAIGLVCGSILAAGRAAKFWPIRIAATIYVEVIRAIPQIMVIFWVFFSAPLFVGRPISAWTAAVISLSMVAAAYLTETIRGGLLSVPKVQVESALVTGLSPTQCFLFVLLPQALRNMLPALLTNTVMMFKTTSLVYVIGLTDFFRAVILINNRSFAPYMLYATLAAVYFVCCYVLSRLAQKLDPKYTILS